MIDLGTRKLEIRTPQGSPSTFIPGLPKGAQLSTSLFRVHVETIDGLIDIAAENVLLLERGRDGELDPETLWRQMETLAGYRFAFVRARASIGRAKKRKERELTQLVASKRREILKEIGNFRNRLRENEGFSASWFGSITKIHIEERLVLDPEYTKIQDELGWFEENETILKGLEECVNGHGFLLKSLGEKIMQEPRGVR